MDLTAVIVDDHQLFRMSARLLLESEGFRVIGEAADAAAALTAVPDLEPDVVLLDVQLPDGSGFEVSRHLVDRACRSRIVLVSSRSAGDYGDQIASSGALGFIRKDQLSGQALRAVLGSEVA